MTCRTDSSHPPKANVTVNSEIDAYAEDDWEVCDRCGRQLDRRANEDIWFSKAGVVLCALCHKDHRGIEVYW